MTLPRERVQKAEYRTENEELKTTFSPMYVVLFLLPYSTDLKTPQKRYRNATEAELI